MSYCRFGSGGSDVYVYRDSGGKVHCCMCSLDDDCCLVVDGPREMIAHLREHQKAGHCVPAAALQRLESEA